MCPRSSIRRTTVGRWRSAMPWAWCSYRRRSATFATSRCARSTRCASAALIVAEDTRVARRLLNALGDRRERDLDLPRAERRARRPPAILERARDGETVAVVTDAGTPGICDPGRELVAAARAAGVAGRGAARAGGVRRAPRCSRDSICGGSSFAGFPPRSGGARRAAFRAALGRDDGLVRVAAPHRRDARRPRPPSRPNAAVFLVRELTKLHEQQVLGTAGGGRRARLERAGARRDRLRRRAASPRDRRAAAQTMRTSTPRSTRCWPRATTSASRDREAARRARGTASGVSSTRASCGDTAAPRGDKRP